jgi:hypothetical protein
LQAIATNARASCPLLSSSRSLFELQVTEHPVSSGEGILDCCARSSLTLSKFGKLIYSGKIAADEDTI